MRTGLRFDKVALELIERVRSGTSEVIPSGSTLVFTVTAPIRLSAKTAAALEDIVRAALARRAASIDIKQMLHGNGVRIQLMPGRASHKVIGFVHNPEIAPELLLDVTRVVLGS